MHAAFLRGKGVARPLTYQMEKRRNFKAEEKAKIVLEVLREEKTLTEIAAYYEVHPNQLSRWKAEFIQNAARAFSKETDEVEKVKQSYEKEKLSLSKQAELLTISRTSLYYIPVSISEEDLYIKRRIDELYTEHPDPGYRRMTIFLNRDYDIKINRKRTRRYMREMGLHGFFPGPNLSKRLHGKYLYPYLLRGLNIDHPNQVWSVDITYCRMRHGFMYMVAVIDWY